MKIVVRAKLIFELENKTRIASHFVKTSLGVEQFLLNGWVPPWLRSISAILKTRQELLLLTWFLSLRHVKKGFWTDLIRKTPDHKKCFFHGVITIFKGENRRKGEHRTQCNCVECFLWLRKSKGKAGSQYSGYSSSHWRLSVSWEINING